MNREQLPNPLQGTVVHIKQSEKYHVLFSDEYIDGDRYDTLCDTFKVKKHASNTELLTIEEANDSQHRMCKNCVNKLSSVYGVESNSCSLCYRDSISSNIELEQINIPDKIKDVGEQYICLECIDHIQKFE